SYLLLGRDIVNARTDDPWVRRDSGKVAQRLLAPAQFRLLSLRSVPSGIISPCSAMMLLRLCPDAPRPVLLCLDTRPSNGYACHARSRWPSRRPERCVTAGHRFFPPTKGIVAACFIHDANWRSSKSSTDANSTPRVDLPIPIGVTGGSGLIS